MNHPKKLIEVALPIKEISAESVRDKSIRHGHISTLHLWWARRPLPVCRAVVFASLVPDPLDENCPQAFRDAIDILLGPENNPGDPFKPYADIPWTSVFDPVEDNHRNRLQMFIGKFSDEMQQHLLHNKPKPASGHQLSDASLIKWESKNNEAIIGKARKLIFVSHQCNAFGSKKTAEALLSEFDSLYSGIKKAEGELYRLKDRHLETPEVVEKTKDLNTALEAFLEQMPKVFDPFAGGGAIPLEAARLGCRSFGNDINPVAHIIQKGSLEFPQKFGKPITYSKDEFIKLYSEDHWNQQPQDLKILLEGEATGIRIENRLSFDVEFYAKKLLAVTEREIGHLYPADENGNKPIAYYWVRVGTCSNPSCQAEVPLLKQFYLSNKEGKQIYLNPIIDGKTISFEIKKGKCELQGWNERANLRCPCCGNFTDTKTLKKQFFEKKTTERILAVIDDSSNGKAYRLPTAIELDVISRIPEIEIPTELMPQNDSQNLKIPFWGYKRFGDMFSKRQLLAMHTLAKGVRVVKQDFGNELNEYQEALVTYLAIWVDRISAVQTSFGRWDAGFEKIQTPFSKQAIPMMFDYPEGNIFSSRTGSALNHIEWILKYIVSESFSFYGTPYHAESGDKAVFTHKYFSAVITDPPYYDAIAYADLSDFFYLWLKRTLGDIFPINFATPQTPKSDECTALKHHHIGNRTNAKIHFELKLSQIFDAIEHQTSDIVSIMFAHQSTEAWTTLCNSVLNSRMNITGSWAMDTEMANRSLGLAGAALESSVTVACKPSQRAGFGDFKQVKKEIEAKVAKEVDTLYGLGFRGADLLTACFGQAVSVFGKYEKVEKADGSEVTVAELLELAKESAFNALLKGFDGDEFTKFYIGWLQLYGFVETDFDDAAKFSRVGLSINVSDLFGAHILLKNQNKQTLGNFSERLTTNKHLGEQADSYLIDQAHRLMHLYKAGDRGLLIEYIHKVGLNPESNLWRVVTSLDELLPKGCDDHNQTRGLLDNKASLIREAKSSEVSVGKQIPIFNQ
jgi:putative DNA methylase